MRFIFTVGLLSLCCAASATAQSQASRGYLGGSFSIDGGSHGDATRLSSVLAGGVLAGVRLGKGWSLEGEIDRGFSEASGTSEGVAFAFGLGPNATREEIERVGVRARWERAHKAGPGFAVHVAWQAKPHGRLGAAVLVGVAAREFTMTTRRTITHVPLDANVPVTQNLSPETEVIKATGGGLSGGLLVTVALAQGLTLAPELRYTAGIMEDSPYRPIRAGVRLMWGF